MIFSLKIKAYRSELKLTQRKLATLLDVSIRTIAYWEGGRLTPKPGPQKMIEKYLDDTLMSFNLTGKLCPINRSIMKERYGGAGTKRLQHRQSKSKEAASGTSGSTRPRITPSVTLSKVTNIDTDEEEREIGFGK